MCPRSYENSFGRWLMRDPLLERMDLIGSVTDYVASHDYDDMMDDVFVEIAPNLVRRVLEREVNEDMAEFLDGAREGRFEHRADWAAKDPSPQEIGYDADAADYVLGYTWGWDNAKTWDGEQLPTEARKEAVERQIQEFEDQISEQMVIAALEAANEKVNPIKLLGKAKAAIGNAVEEEGLAGGLKKGLPIAMGILVGEALDNVIIPMAFFSLTGIPIPPLPIGVGEVINPIVISVVGASETVEDLPDEIGWYEKEYGSSLPGERPKNEEYIRMYVREMLLEVNEYGWNKADRKTMGQDGKAKGRQKKNWVGQNTNDVITNWYKKMGLAEALSLLSESVEFREVDSPLKYSRSGNVKRIAYCDSAVTDPPEKRDAYFKEWENWRKFSKGGKRLKKPVLEEIVPGVSDVCVIGFLDYHQQTKNSDGSTMWYIDYMKTRGDSQGRGVASKLMDQFYETVPQPGDHVHFGKMMREEIGHLKDKMKEKYPEVETIGAVYY